MEATKPTSRFYYRDMVVDLMQAMGKADFRFSNHFTIIRLLLCVNRRSGFDYGLGSWITLRKEFLRHYDKVMHLAECLDERRFTPMP